MSTLTTLSEQDFLAALRSAVERYFEAVDSWEAGFRRYDRMPEMARASSDLAQEQQRFETCRNELQQLLPRARALCFKYDQRDVFAGLPHVTLGRHAPQHRVDSAISRGERGAVMACLIELSAAINIPAESETARSARASLLERIAGFTSALLQRNS